MTIVNVVSISGMIFDVLGAVILARSFILKRPEEVFRDLKSFGVWNFHTTRGARNLLLSWLVQRLEAQTGAAVIGIGFVLQAASQLLPARHLQCASLILSGVFVFAVWSFFMVQNWFVKNAVKHALVFYDELEARTTNEDRRKRISLLREELRQFEQEPKRWLQQVGENVEPFDKTLSDDE